MALMVGWNRDAIFETARPEPHRKHGETCFGLAGEGVGSRPPEKKHPLVKFSCVVHTAMVCLFVGIFL